LQPSRQAISFDSRSGQLNVSKQGDKLILDFPALLTVPANERIEAIAGCFDHRPLEVHVSNSDFGYLPVFDNEAAIPCITPDFHDLSNPDRGVIVTARGYQVDFVSRFFAPLHGIPEDPVTGGAHCLLTPYWAGKLGKAKFHARQLSRRGGELQTELVGNRVHI